MRNPIKVYTPYIELLAVVNDYVSLQFIPRFYDVGEFELHVNMYMEGAEHFSKGNIVIINDNPGKGLLIRKKEIALDENGMATENYKITGVTLEGLVDQRITIPPSHTSHDRKSGPAETVMKHYVYNHLVNPRDPSRKMPLLEIAPDYGRGSHISNYESRLKPLDQELSTIAKRGDLGWFINVDVKNRKLIFDTVEPRDMRKNNTVGNEPIVFSPELSTIKTQKFIDSDEAYKNIAYVAGQGEGVDREIVVVDQANFEYEKSGMYRKEVLVDANDIGNGDGAEGDDQLTDAEIREQLRQRGFEKLAEEYGAEFFLEGQILTPNFRNIQDKQTVVMDSPYEYEKDFFLGDYVTVQNTRWGVQIDVPITEFKEVHEPSGFILEATFGEAQPTIVSKIKSAFDNLIGVDKQELPAKLQVIALKKATELVTEEERKRIEEAKKNLQESKEFVENYAEKKRVESPTEPEDKSVIWIDTSDPSNLVMKVYSEILGEWVANTGEPGIQGPPGKDGQSLYTWIKYADDQNGNGMSESPIGKSYIGIAYNKNVLIESDDPAQYNWSKIEGDKGDQGVEGPPGENGESLFTWIKYADDANGTNMSDSPAGKSYLGIAYNKTSRTESSDPTQYSWSKIEGPKGDQGIQGPAGKDGQSLYTWLKYADDENGNGMSDDPTGKTYMGLAYNKTSQTEGTNPADYSWTKVEGKDGVPGPPGEDGQPTYTWIKYADNAGGGNMSDDPTGKTYIGIAYNKTTLIESNDPKAYQWALIKGDKGDKGDQGIQGPQGERGPQGVQGPQGEDGQVFYTWLKYADSPTTGMSDDPTGKRYIGLAYNKVTATESSNYSDYTWSLIQGPEGEQGPQGNQGVQGPAGKDGQPTYTWIKYATSSTGSNMSDDPTGKTYIGLAYNKLTQTESSNAADYTWSLIQGPKGDKGEQGPQGIQGPKGADGQTYYTWLKYADSPTSGMSDSPTGKKYIGLAYNKASATESTNYADYTWSLIQGPQGDQGVQGPKGADGQPTYTWVKYATTSTGLNMSDDPTGKTYIGLAYNKTTPNESTNASDYTWALIQGPKGDTGATGPQGPTGPKGEQGTQGIQGPKGADGVSLYTWVKYADSPTTGMSDNPAGKKYIGFAYNKTSASESNVYSDYSWSLIEGPKGDTGVQGPAGANGQTTYTWIKYADDENGSGMSDSPTNKRYLGIAVNKTTANESSNANDYTWTPLYDNVKPGGRNYLFNTSDQYRSVTFGGWDKYLQTIVFDDVGWEAGDVLTARIYLKTVGQPVRVHLDFRSADSSQYDQHFGNVIAADTEGYSQLTTTIPASKNGVPITKVMFSIRHTSGSTPSHKVDYKWEMLERGNVASDWSPAPEDKKGLYTWVKYATSSTGANMSDDPSGKTYIGMAYNKDTDVESTNASDYTWSLIQGPQGPTGPQGNQGVQGPPGADGTPRYTWIKYADSASGAGLSDSPTNKKYIGLAHNKATATESTNAADYTWALIQGPQGPTGQTGSTGPQGPQGPQGPNIVNSNTQIEANVIKSNHIQVSSLSAISANLGTVTSADLTSTSGTGSVRLYAGRIESKYNGRMSVEIRNWTVTFYDSDSPYERIGSIGSTSVNDSYWNRGMSIVGDKDYLSIGARKLDGSLSSQPFARWELPTGGGGGFGIVSGGTIDLDHPSLTEPLNINNATLELRAAYGYTATSTTFANQNNDMAKVMITHSKAKYESLGATGGDVTGTVVAMVGHPTRKPTASSKTGFEVWQYDGNATNGTPSTIRRLMVLDKSPNEDYDGTFVRFEVDNGIFPKSSYFRGRDDKLYRALATNISSRVTSWRGADNANQVLMVDYIDVTLNNSGATSQAKVRYDLTGWENCFGVSAQPHNAYTDVVTCGVEDMTASGFSITVRGTGVTSGVAGKTIRVMLFIVGEQSPS